MSLSRIGLGCDELGASLLQNKVADPDRFLNACLDAGINFFDTAHPYTYGHSEELLGKTLSTQRNRAFIFTKGGKLKSTGALMGGYLKPIASVLSKFIHPKKNFAKKLSKPRADFSQEHLTQQLHESLKRLKTDYVDGYLLHSPTIAHMGQYTDLLETIHKFKKEGKARYVGVSVNTVEEAKCIIRLGPAIDVMQLPYNVIDPTFESIFEELKDKNIGLLGRLVYGKGILTQEYIDNKGNPDSEAVLAAVSSAKAKHADRTIRF